MKEILLTVIAIVAIFLALPISLLWLRDRKLHRLPTREEQEEMARKFDMRLRSPNFPELEDHFGHPLPAPLHALYNDLDELMLGDIDVLPPDGSDPIYICFYVPADAESHRSP